MVIFDIILVISILIILFVILLLMIDAISNKNFSKSEDYIDPKLKIVKYKIYNGNQWSDYRLGDLINNWKNTRGSYSHLLSKKWKNTIANKYLNMTSDSNNIKILDKVVKQYPIMCPINTAVLHLRLGDVLKIKNDNFYYRFNTSKKHYVKPLSFYKNLNIQSANLIIICGAHKNENIYASQYFLNMIIDIFKHKNPVVLSGDSPDHDLCIMATTKELISSGSSGFCKLAGLLVKYNKGIVI